MIMEVTGIYIAALSAFSALLGVALGHRFTTRRSRDAELAALKISSYVDFIRSTARLVTARRGGRTIDDLEELTLLNDAKTRVCICAELPVVERLEEFWLQGGTLEREQEILAFRALCDEMRISLGRERISLKVDLSGILFKLEPSTYSYRTRKSQE